jgi:Zn-dependent peptidase ImmA (M78 family)
MILLSLRGRGEDRFWFSFFHEAGHVLHDGKKDLLINDDSQDDPREVKANNFAAETLIPSGYDAEIKRFKSGAEIVRLAEELKISEGIVAGRYQYLTGRWQYYKGMIRKFEWAD